MDNPINDEELVQFLRDRVEPVNFKDLVSRYCDPKSDKKIRRNTIVKLKETILSLLTAGLILHSYDYFYAASVLDDHQAYVVLSSDEEEMSDNSSISYSSSSSGEINVPNFDKLEEDSSSEEDADEAASSEVGDLQTGEE